MNKKSTILLSIKPEYADMIFSGKKTVELRKFIPEDLPSNAEIVIYVSSPVQSIIGKAYVKEVQVKSPKELWKKLGNKTGVSIDYFKKYFDGKTKGYGIVLDKVEKFSKPHSLSVLRSKLNFHPPQSFMYARPELINYIS